MVSESPESLREFLRTCVPSYEALEILLLMAQEPPKAWHAAELSAACKLADDLVGLALESLCAAGLLEVLEPSGQRGYRFAPESDALGARVVELGRAYDEQRLLVIRLMSENALERLRGAAVSRLAEAFLFERRKK